MRPLRTLSRRPARRVPMALPMAFLLALPVLASPVLAQVGAPSGVPRRAQPAAPAEPAPAAPQPPDLTQPPRPATPPERMALLALPPSMMNLPEGGWRIEGPPATGRIDPATTNTLAEIARRLALIPGRVTIVAQVAGPAEDISVARRAALAHAQEVRRALEAGGLPGTRIDLRPIGRTAMARDAVELLPPGVPSPSLSAQSQQAAPPK